MLERFHALRRADTKRESFFSRLRAHVRSLSPSDKIIAASLAALTFVMSFAALYALERSFLVEVPSKGGTLVEGVAGSPRFVNPLLALSDADRDMVALTYAGLMGYGADGTLVPVIAETYTLSEDGKIYTFTLRADAKFSDGTPVTAEDVVFTVNKAQDVGLKSPELANWANILVEAVDARTVRFTLPKAYAPFLTDATLGILPAHVWRDIGNEEFPFSRYMTEPIGAGPYKVSKIWKNKDGGIERYDLSPFADYALGEAYLSRITLMFFKTQAEVATALSRGRIESAYGVPEEGALRAPYFRTFGVFFNQNHNPLFARIEVRKALSLATDRDGLVRDVLGGFGTALTGPVPATGTARAANAEPSFSLEEARAVLERNDWTFDETAGVWKHTDDGLELRVTIRTSNVTELRAVADAIREDWGALGVPVSFEFYEPNELAQNVIRPREYDALLFGMVLGRDYDLFPFWHSSERNDPGLNIAMYANKDVDELLTSMRTETDAAVLREDLQEVNNLIAADYPAAFTHAPDFVYAVPHTLQGVALGAIAEPSDRFATVRFWYRYTEWVWPFFYPSE